MSNGQQQQPQQPKSEGKLIPFKERLTDFRSFIEKGKDQLAMALPKHITADRILRILMTEIQRTPSLLDCTRESVWGALLQCAQLGLEPGGVLGQAYLVPFKNRKNNGRLEVQLMPGYKGLVKLAYQSGEVGAIRARIVREKDKFYYEYGVDETLVHVPDRSPDPGQMVAVYAVAKIKGIDEAQFVVLERWEVELIRQRSASSTSGPWVTDEPEMWKKSAIRRLCKLLPASTEKDNLAKAIAIDEAAEAGLPQFHDVIDIQPAEAVGDDGAQEAVAPAPEPTKLDKLAADVKDKAAKKQMSILTPGAPSQSKAPEDQLPESLGGDRVPGADDVTG